MQDIVVAGNLNDDPDQRLFRSNGPLISDHRCEAREGKQTYGKHFVFVAAVYETPSGAGGAGKASCNGSPPHITSSQKPVRAVAGVVAITDEVIVARSRQRVAINAASELLLGPVKKQLELDIPRPAQRRR
jgi:hypothetical protein